MTSTEHQPLLSNDRQQLLDACTRRDWDTVLVLLPELCEVSDNAGWTPLMYALRAKADVRVLERLLVSGCDPNKKNTLGRTAVHFAAQAAAPIEVFELLIRYGGDVTKRTETGDLAEDIARNAGVKDDKFFEFVRAQVAPLISKSTSMRRTSVGSERMNAEMRAPTQPAQPSFWKRRCWCCVE